MSYKNQPMNMDQALVIIAELENKLRISEEAVKLLNEDLKEMFQRLKKAQRTASDFQERYNGLLSENRELNKKNSYMRGSLNRLYGEVSNGEHLTKEWIEGALLEEPVSRLTEALNSKVSRLESENRTLVEVARFYADKNSVGYNTKTARETLKKLGYDE